MARWLDSLALGRGQGDQKRKKERGALRLWNSCTNPPKCVKCRRPFAQCIESSGPIRLHATCSYLPTPYNLVAPLSHLPYRARYTHPLTIDTIEGFQDVCSMPLQHSSLIYTPPISRQPHPVRTTCCDTVTSNHHTHNPTLPSLFLPHIPIPTDTPAARNRQKSSVPHNYASRRNLNPHPQRSGPSQPYRSPHPSPIDPARRQDRV